MARVSPQQRHLIALDLDGTVLDHGHVGQGNGKDTPFARETPVDPELAAAIRALESAGHLVIPATGRSVDATLPIVETIRIRPEWVVCANGAVTLKRNPLATRAYRREYVESFDATDLLVRVRPHLAGARFGVELADGTFAYTEEIPAGTLPTKQRRVNFDELLGTQVSRVLVMSPTHRLEDFLGIAESLGLSNVSYAVGDTMWLDIAPEGVSKDSALEVIASRNNIPLDRVFAAGDGMNDIKMLEWAARYGVSVAMGQANDEVKAAANTIAPPVEENGLLTVLREKFAAQLDIR